MGQDLPKGKVVLKILSPPKTEKSSGKLVAVQTCLQACMVYSGICCQGIYHLFPTLSESIGVINCSGNANSVSHSALLSHNMGHLARTPKSVGLWVQNKKVNHVCGSLQDDLGQAMCHPNTHDEESVWHVFGQQFCCASGSQIRKILHLPCGNEMSTCLCVGSNFIYFGKPCRTSPKTQTASFTWMLHCSPFFSFITTSPLTIRT